MDKKDIVKMIPTVNGEPVYVAESQEMLGDLIPSAIDTIKSALGRRDKFGFADKVALDGAKFVFTAASAKDSDEYKSMLLSFREMIMKSRKKEEVLAEVKDGE